MSHKRDEDFTQVLKELAESSSLHGIPKIVSSRQLSVKILWCLLVLATFCVMSYQLYSLFTAFYSYPVVTRVNLEFSNLRYPDITFCNMNPVKKSKTDIAAFLKEVLYKKQQKSDRNKQEKEAHNIKPKQSDDPVGPPTRTKRFLNDTNSGDDNVTSYNHDESLDDELNNDTTSTPPPSLEEGIDTRLNSSSATNSSEEYYYYYDYWYYDSDDAEDEWNHTHIDDILGGSSVDEHTMDLWKSPRDAWKARRDLIKTEIKKAPLKVIREVGHQLEDVVISFSFAGRRQNTSKIRQFTSPHYGNCFKISSKRYKAWRSGPDHGMKLTLNLENSEYISSFASGFGMRMVFHEPGSLAMPNEEGITISSGFDTSIGLRTVEITRLSEPYGTCSDGEEFTKQFGRKYSVAACMEYCRVNRVIHQCRCIPFDAPEQYRKETVGVDVCRSGHHDEFCAMKVEYEMKDSKGGRCDCPSPCNEIVYDKSLSGRKWPSEEYLSKVLMREVCRRNISSMSEACYERENGTFQPSKYVNNFLTVRIYYEDLNYESITQEPMYEPVRFISDIGGAMGLFMGVSVLSVVELLQLILEICLFISRRLKSSQQSSTGSSSKAMDPMI